MDSVAPDQKDIRFEVEQQLLAQARDEERVRENADECLGIAEVIDLRSSMSRGGWLRLLGEKWIWFGEDATRCASFLRELLRDEPLPLREMMTDRERERFDRLPEELTVRGCWPDNAAGICWSLSNRTASRIWNGEAPLLLTGVVPKSRVIALKLGWGETEIVSFDVREVKRDNRL